jgi:DNA-binding transcriptional regulator YiaG
MKTKMASNTKGKAPSVTVAGYGKKPGGHQTIHSSKREKASGWELETGIVVGKSKSTYSALATAPLQLHDADHAVEFATAAPFGLPNAPQERESELSDELLTEVARESGDVRELCEKYELKREELGRLTGFSLRALAEWAAGKLPSQPAKRRLQEVRRLLDALAQIVKAQSIPAWLHQRNPAFDHLTPLQVIELGEMDRLWAMVHDLQSGQPE